MRKTSLEAYRSLTGNHKAKMYNLIIKVCKRLKTGGTFEDIARAARIEPSRVWKRLSELVAMKILINTGETRPTSSGRQAMVRKINPVL